MSCIADIHRGSALLSEWRWKRSGLGGNGEVGEGLGGAERRKTGVGT